MNSLCIPETTPSLHDLSPTSAVADCVASLRAGDWSTAALDGLTSGFKLGGAIADPLGTGLSTGVEWLIEHIHPLTRLLDELAGQPDVVRGKAELATTQAGRLRADAAAFATHGWEGQAGNAFRSRQESLTDLTHTAADALDATGNALANAATTIDAVRSFVRGLVADVIADAMKWIVLTGLSGGSATPALVLRVSSKVAAAVARASNKISDLAAAIQRLVSLLGRLRSAVGDLTRRAKAMLRPHQAPDTRPLSRRDKAQKQGVDLLARAGVDSTAAEGNRQRADRDAKAEAAASAP